MKGKPVLITKEQIVLPKNVILNTYAFSNRLLPMENKVDLLERFQAFSCFETEINEAFANNSCSVLNDVSVLVDACNEIGIKMDLA